MGRMDAYVGSRTAKVAASLEEGRKGVWVGRRSRNFQFICDFGRNAQANNQVSGT